MTKELVSIDQNEWETEVNLKVSTFQNFGARMGDVQLKFFQALTGKTAGNPAGSEEHDATEFPMPDYKGMLADMAGKALEMAADIMAPEEHARIKGRLAEIKNKDWRPEFEVGEADSKTFSVDLQALRVICPANSEWDATTEARLDGFLADWPLLRGRVLQAVGDFYADQHRKNLLFPDPILAPKPGSLQLVDDRIRIASIYLREDGLIGLSGECTWNEEHGLGVLLDDGRIIETGHADVAFEQR